MFSLLFLSPGIAIWSCIPIECNQAAWSTTMTQATARSLIAKTITLLARLDAVERIVPVLSENNLADPDLEIDASMDHRIPGNASADLLRQAQPKRWPVIPPLPRTR